MIVSKLVVVCALLVSLCCGQDIGYPESPEVEQRRQNAKNRLPLFIPGRCQENELLFPGDHDDWICDCAPGHLYHPASNRCHQAYRQGPCSNGKIIILESGKVVPVCVDNSCRVGQVLYEGKCYALGQPGPCPSPELSNVVGVNPTTLKLDCVIQSAILRSRFSDSAEASDITSPEELSRLIFKNIPICAKGTKRSINGQCL